MLTFAVAVAEQGQRVPVAVTALLSEVTLDEVPFFARRHVLWSAPSGSVVFAGWQDTTRSKTRAGAAGTMATAGSPHSRVTRGPVPARGTGDSLGPRNSPSSSA